MLVTPTKTTPQMATVRCSPSISDRLSAITDDQCRWRKPAAGAESTPRPFSVSVGSGLSARKSALLQSSEGWRNRVKTPETDLQMLSSTKRLEKATGFVPRPKSANSTPVRIDRGMDKFFGSDVEQKAPATQLNVEDFDSVVGNDDRISPPQLQRARRPGRPPTKNSRKSVPVLTKNVEATSDKDLPVDYRQKKGDSEASAKAGLQAKEDFSAVQLKKCDTTSPYPSVMLIRIKGDVRPDVRLVAPRANSVNPCGVYILILQDRLFQYIGEFANLREKSAAAQMIFTITSTGELGCSAKVPESVLSEASYFWKVLGGFHEQSVPRELALLEDCFEDLAVQKANLVLRVTEDFSIQSVVRGEAPRVAILKPDETLIFDFGSEIYVWVGRSADRNAAKCAMDYAEQLRNQSIEGADLILGQKTGEGRGDWIVVRKIFQGLNDELFRRKFIDWASRTPNSTPKRRATSSPSEVIHDEVNEERIAEELGARLSALEPIEPVLILEETELRSDDENVYTESLAFWKLKGEVLVPLEGLDEFEESGCYVVKWMYRVERQGVRKFDGTQRDHDTGRQRVAYFYWLGKATTPKEQGVCALALRDLDRERRNHIRVLQNYEPEVFLGLFKGRLVIKGTGTNVFLVRNSRPSLRVAEEVSHPVVLRSQASYLVLDDSKKELLAVFGCDCDAPTISGTLKLTEARKPSGFTVSQAVDGDPRIQWEILRPDGWSEGHPPRFYRIFESEGEEKTGALTYRFSAFPFLQSVLSDCMLVDQGNSLWIWSDGPISTFALRVATRFWKDRKGPATVIYRSNEPAPFKALFPSWTPFETDEEEQQKKPESLESLLAERTRFWPLESLLKRDLPEGADMKHLERYLCPEEFEKVFKMGKDAFTRLPQWKQIRMRKEANLF
uniref:HP domain-containing protein n=1 Tax=Steinernema glaseri TaxID=37863 RepID=A0A1I7Y0P2_9BILA